MRKRGELPAKSPREQRKKRDVVEEIKRRKSERWEVYLHIDPHKLKEIADRASSDADVILQLIPVRAVAIIERFTRHMVAEFIDKGPPYLDRAEYIFQSLEQRSDFKTVSALAGQSISLGNFVSHMLRFSSLSDIAGVMDHLLDIDYFHTLTGVRKRISDYDPKFASDAILGETRNWYPPLEEMFAKRHAIAHESSRNAVVTRDQAEKFVEVTRNYLRAAWEFTASTLQPDYPLSQDSMNRRAQKDYENAVRDYDACLEKEKENISNDPEHLRRLEASEKLWAEFVDLHASFAVRPIEQGSMSPCIAFGEAERLVRQRSAYFRDWLAREEGSF